MPSTVMSWGLNFFMFLIILVINIIYKNYFTLTGSFLKILIFAAILDALATILYLSAIKQGNLSKVIPMLCFIPLVQLFIAPILVNETLSVPGISGVLLVVCGSYLLNMESWENIFSPIKSVFNDKSSMMMLAVACIWGVSSSFHKIGVQQTNALFWGVTEIGLISLILLPFAIKIGPKHLSFSNLKLTIWPAIFSTLTVLTYYSAISLSPVAYISSVRRLGVLFSMIAGIVIFKETIKGLGFVGGMVMIAGAAIISLFG